MQRTNGFYWVKDNRGCDWYIAEWIDDSWCVCGLDYSLSDDKFQEIGERVKCPYEQE